MEHKLSKLFILTTFCISLLLVASPLMAAKVYRWVDENGEVHYSSSLPPDFQDKSHDELDERGIVRAEGQTLVPPPPVVVVESPDVPKELPRDSSGLQRPKALYSEKEMQEKMDRFLLLRYDSTQEIEDAMSVEIKQLEYDRRLLEKSRNSLYAAYRGQIQQAADRQRSGVELEPKTGKSITDLRTRLANNQQTLDGLQQREVKIRENFGAEIERYQYLLDTWSEEG